MQYSIHSQHPPPSPAPYSLPQYAAVGVHGHQQHHQSHQPHHHLSHTHHASLTLQSFASPTTIHQLTTQAPNRQSQGSPTQNGTSTGTLNAHWSQQLLKAELCRQSNPPHHRARQSALATRNAAKAAIPIQNPNIKSLLPLKENGHVREDSISSHLTTSSVQDPVDTEHPSSLNPPIATLQRPSAPRNPEGTWTILDMGGMQLKNLSRGLFNFTFLTTLYLNHNLISTLPPEISRLRNLTHLDLSGNRLVFVPPALGMLTNLRELFLFDNQLVTLPPQLGSLHQLEMLGIEGNPLEEKLRSIARKDGTVGLISYLRDNFLPVDEPQPRPWRSMVSDAERKTLLADGVPISLVCYNILCERAATSQLYGYTPTWALAWNHRKDKILKEICETKSDIICLQEVPIGHYDDLFHPFMRDLGYDSCFTPKLRAKTMDPEKKKEVDGCAIFFKESKFRYIEASVIEFSPLALQRPDMRTEDMFNRMASRGDIAIGVLLEEKTHGLRLVVATAHIHWDPEFRDVKLVQVSLLVQELEQLVEKFAKMGPIQGTDGTWYSAYENGADIPLILCGDYNSVPDSGVYQLLSTGSVPSDHPDFISKNYGKFTSHGVSHHLGLRSAYAGMGELPLTNYTSSFQGAIDYIWFSSQTMEVLDVLGEVDEEYLSKVVGFPNAHFPSDHIMLSAELVLKMPRKPPVKITGRNSPPPGYRRGAASDN